MLEGWGITEGDTSIREDDGRNVTISPAKIKGIYLEGCSAGRWPNPDDYEACELARQRSIDRFADMCDAAKDRAKYQ